jgi:holo-[acyl-carrier protein] synthase
MDVLGLGVDIIEIDRMRRVLERTPSFKTRVFSQGERDYCESKARPEVHYALRFAAKEAVFKALGVGFAGMRATDVEVGHDRNGKPLALLYGSAARLAQEQGVLEMHLSLSFTHTVGVANAVAVTADSRPASEDRIDQRAELAAAFKEARSLLDELDARGSADQDDGKSFAL